MPADSYTADVHIRAAPERVFEHFTRPEALTRWMGQRATLDPSPGGVFSLDFVRVKVRGRYLVVDPPHRLVFSWGHEGSDVMPPGTSTVEVTFTPQEGGCLVRLVHRDLPVAERPRHALGWQHYVVRLAGLASGSDPGKDPWMTSPPPFATAPSPAAE